MSNTTEFVNGAIKDNKIAFFSKSYCPYCKAAKTLLKNEYSDAQVAIYELDEREDGDAIQATLEQVSGQRTVPNIFINTKHIGGNSDLQALHKNGALPKLIAQSA